MRNYSKMPEEVGKSELNEDMAMQENRPAVSHNTEKAKRFKHNLFMGLGFAIEVLLFCSAGAFLITGRTILGTGCLVAGFVTAYGVGKLIQKGVLNEKS